MPIASPLAKIDVKLALEQIGRVDWLHEGLQGIWETDNVTFIVDTVTLHAEFVTSKQVAGEHLNI